MAARPNFIFLIADDHRYESIAANGCSEVRTPTLDALAASGTVFDSAHCQGSMQPAVCVPSRASLMTGRNIFASSQNPSADDYCGGPYDGPAFAIPPELPTFPQRLRENGYHTHAIGKWHNDRASFARSFSSGERLMFGGMSDHDKVPYQPYDPTGAYPKDAIRFEGGFSTDLFLDSAKRFLTGYRSKEPFCLYVAFTAPHDPRTPPAAFTVDPATVSLPPNYLPIHPFDNGEALVRDEELEAFPRSPEAIRQHIADYYGMIAHLDNAIGSLLETVREAGLDRNTVVIYTADHGLALGQHGLMGKQNLYEHSLHIPLIVAGPGIPAGHRVPALVWHGDTRATVLDLAGIPLEGESEGASLLPLVRGEATALRETFAGAYRVSHRMIRDARWKLIRYYEQRHFPELRGIGEGQPTEGSSVEQLFDLTADPGERMNLVVRRDLQPVRSRLSRNLEAWQRAAGDPMLRSPGYRAIQLEEAEESGT
jgi:arylsulfatase A-like enzyme